MTKGQRIVAQIVMIMIVLTVAVGAMQALLSLKKPPEKKDQIIVLPLLNAVSVTSESVQMMVSGYGTVEPRSDVQVVPQVSGRIIRCHDQWVDGGFFKAGEPLIVIEDSDYRLAVQSAEAMVAQSSVALEQEQAEADIARREWQKLNPGQTPQSDLVFRGPQIKNAQAQLKAAQAQLAKAQLDMERTTISMPFDGRIVSTTVDNGQFVTAGAPVASVYRTDLVEIAVPLENTDLEWFNVPLSMIDRRPDQYNSSTAVVSADFAGKKYSWQGRAVRTEGKIDERSRQVQVVIQVDDPFKIDNGGVPLVPGMFVKVEIRGRQLDDVIRVPRYAMHGEDDQVWVTRAPDSEIQRTSSDGNQDKFAQKTLRIVTVKVLRLDKEYAYIRQGLADGDIIVTSPLETVTDGMQIRIVLEGGSQQEKSL